MKYITSIIIILILACLLAFFIFSKKDNIKSVDTTKSASGFDFKNATYNIDDEVIILKNGSFDSPISSSSATVITTKYFGNEAKGDLNDDGKEDTAFLLTQYGGGTGVFFYVVSALNTGNGYKITNSVFLGDRISPQSTEIKDGKIIVNYADRRPGEPFVAEPSVGVSKYFKIIDGELKEI